MRSKYDLNYRSIIDKYRLNIDNFRYFRIINENRSNLFRSTAYCVASQMRSKIDLNYCSIIVKID